MSSTSAIRPDDETQSLLDKFVKHPERYSLSIVVPKAGELPVVLKSGHQPLRDYEVRVMMITMGYCGRDKSILTGQKNAAPGRIGHEGAGIVIEKGSGVENVEIGQRVIVFPFIRGHNIGYDWPGGGMGIFSTFPIIPADAAYSVPQEEVNVRDWLALSLVEPFAGVIRGLLRADIRRKDFVLILGAGPIGCAQAIVTKYVHPGIRVVLADIRRDRLRVVHERNIPADDFILSTHADDLRHCLDRASCPLVIHSNPFKGSLKQAIDICPDQGTVLLFSGVYDWSDADNRELGKGITIDPQAIHYEKYDIKHPVTVRLKHKTVRLIGSRGFTKAEFHKSARLITDRKIDPTRIVTRVLKFDEAILHNLSQEGDRDSNIKILMSPYDAIVGRGLEQE